MRKRVLRIIGVAMAIALILGLMPMIPASALTGTISALDYTSGPPGTTVSFTGTGFTPSSYFTAYFGSLQTTSGWVTSGGNLTVSFIVPTYARGIYNVTVTTNTPDTSNTRQFTITPGISLSASSGGVGDQITVSGNGFSASNSVSVSYDTTTQLTATTNANGTFSSVVTIPNTTRGSHYITAYDIASSLSSTVMFTIVSKVTISPTSVAIGSQLVITGTGFATNSNVTVYLDSVSITSTTSNTYGGFTISNFTFPATTSGSHTLKFQDSSSNYVTNTITIISSISIAPINGTVGTAVNIDGTGFRANETISLYIDGTNLAISGVTSNAVGSFSTSVTIPAIASGTHQLKAADSINNDTEAFVVTASTISSPTSGYSGTKITVNGNGFLANQTATVTFDNTPVGTTAINAQGSFSMSFDAPSRQAGVYKVRATDGTNFTESNFNVTTSVKFTTETSAASPGYVGAPITINGVGFKAGATISVTYDGKEIKTGTVGSDTNFSITFNAPASKAGEHTVTVSDGTVMLPLKYYMDATAPTSPVLATPETGVRQKATGKFTWNSVTDPSGITYELQIANDASFSAASMIFEKKGLTATEYTLTKAEKLKNTKKDAPDFWRVRAVDGAENTGNWSNIWSFTVGSILPAWALWVMIILGAAIILLFAFWLGRRSSGSKRISTRIMDNQ